MYEPDTILKLKEPRTVGTPPQGDPESENYVPASDDYDPFPYDRVRVIGQSPINHGIANSDWSGTNAQGVIITPLDGFGSTLDEPLGKIQALYAVESTPVHEAPAVPVRVINSRTADAGPTPEDVFAEEAAKNPQPPTRRAARKSPLDDPRPTVEEAGPLGAVEAPQEG